MKLSERTQALQDQLASGKPSQDVYQELNDVKTKLQELQGKYATLEKQNNGVCVPPFQPLSGRLM